MAVLAHGEEDLVNDVLTKCPTKAITLVPTAKFQPSEHVSAADLGNGKTRCIDNKNCVR